MPSDAVVEGVSGALGGIVATVATYPLMTVNTLQTLRVRTQSQQAEAAADAERGQAAGRQGKGGGGGGGRGGRGKGTLAELAELVRTSGWRALFAGLEASLVGTAVSQGIYFYLYSLLRRLAVLRRAAAEAAAAAAAGGVARLQQQPVPADLLRGTSISVGESLLVAALAGMGNVLLTNPIWMVATRMQALSRANGGGSSGTNSKPSGGAGSSDSKAASAAAAPGQQAARDAACVEVAPPSRLGILAVSRQIYGEYGLAGFWNGCGAGLVMVVNPTIQYALYEWLQGLRARLRQQRGKGAAGGGAAAPAAGRASALEVFLLSAVAKAGATLLTYPLITVKTRMYAARKGDARQYTSVLQAMAQILREEGVGGYFQGLRTKIVQSVLAAALLFVAKEKITDFTRDVLLAPRQRAKPLHA